MKPFSMTGAAILYCGIAFSACSTTPYKGAVSKFATASTTATLAANAELSSTVSATRADAVTTGNYQLLSRKWHLTMTEECTQLLQPKRSRTAPFDQISESDLIASCNLQQDGKPSNQVIAKFESELDRLKVREAKEVLVALNGYADGLGKIVNADDFTELRTATSGLGSSIAKISALAGPEGLAASAAVQPAVKIVTEIGLFNLEHRRQRLLRAIVPQTNSAIFVLSSELDKSLDSLRSARLAAALSAMTSTQLAWNEGLKDDAVARALTETILEFRNSARLAQRSGPFSKLAAAHQALAEAVERDATKEQFDVFLGRLGELEASVNELQVAINKIEGA